MASNAEFWLSYLDRQKDGAIFTNYQVATPLKYVILHTDPEAENCVKSLVSMKRWTQ